MERWLLGAEPLGGELGTEGSQAKLVNRVGSRDMVMIEMVERKNLQDEMTCIYEASGLLFGAWNRVTNRFRPLDPERSEWQLECEFRCRGLLKMMAVVMSSIFHNATFKEMNNFKKLVERGEVDA